MVSNVRQWYRVATAFVAAFGLSLCPCYAQALQLDALAVPPNTSVAWVGRDIVQNGMPMQILELKSGLSIAEIERFYRQDWREYHRPGARVAIRRTAGEWQLISTLIDHHNVVVQLKREGARTTGFISSHPLDTPTTEGRVAQEFPRKWGTKLVSSTESTDAGVQATTLILKNSHTVRQNQRFYQKALQSKGWTLARNSLKNGTAVMLFNRASTTMELALRSDNRATLIFANLKGRDV